MLLLALNTAWAQLIPIKVALDWYINPDQAPLLVAQAKGYFQQQGLQVALLTPTEETEPVKLVATQQADFGVSNQLGLLQAVTQGLPLVRVASLAAHTMTCIAAIDPNIHSLQDLQNQPLGYSGGPLSPALVKQMFLNHHLNPNEVTFINVKMNLIQALLSHQITAAVGMVRSVEVVQLQQMGYHPTIFKPEDYGIPPYEEMVFVANRQHLNPTVVNAFVTALTAGAQYLAAHPEESWQLVSQQYAAALAPSAAMKNINHAIWMASIPYFGTQPATVNTQQYQQFSDFLVKLGILPYNPPLTDYVWHTNLTTVTTKLAE